MFEAIILGIVQGLTEFLPISSTAHLTLAGKILGLIDPHHPETWTAFIAVMQLGTLAAVVIFFFKDLWRMYSCLLADVFRNGLTRGFKDYSHDSLLGIYVLLGTLPVGLIGLTLHKVIEGNLTKSTLVIIGSLVTLAGFLWIAEKVATHKRGVGNVTLKDAIVIGFAQALALIPGSSRSGTTITAGLFLGLTREGAARFSFLLSVPAVFASGVYELSQISGGVFSLGLLNLLVATIVSAIAGYAAIAWLLRYLWNHTTMVFVWYRIGLGILLAVLLAGGFLPS